MGKLWRIGNLVKMADNKIAKELLDKIDVFEHTHVARHIPRLAEITLKYFENSGLSCEYFLDLDEVFIKNKHKLLKFCTPDPDHVYDIFGKYSHEEANVVRTSVIDYITCDPISFRERMVVMFTMLHLDLEEWLLRTKNPNTPADEAAVYGLCQLYSRHALAYTTGSVWSTLEIHGKCSLEEVKRHCDVHLVFLEGGVLGQLHKKPTIPRLMSVSTVTSAASKTDRTLNDTPATVATDHTYSSPTPKPMHESSSEAKPASDHTYAEYSDTPTEPYGSDTEQALDSVSTGVTKDGWLIVASTDKLEISVEYLHSTTLLEATCTSQNASEMILDALNAGIVRASLNKNEHSLVPDETIDHEALLEAMAAPEPQDVSLTDETQRLLSDEPNPSDKRLPDATDTTDLSKAQLPDKTLDVLPDGMHQHSPILPDETLGISSHTESPEAMKLLVKPDNTTTETNSPAEQEKTESDMMPTVSDSDVTAQPRQNEETLRVTTTPSPLPGLEISKEHTDAMETTTEQIIREIPNMEHSDDSHSVKSLSDIPSSFKPVDTSSVVSELPEFSHTPDTKITNNTNGSSASSPSQGTGSPDNKIIDTTESSGSSQTKQRRLKTCIIRLTELSNQEREQWMSRTSQTTSTPTMTSSSYDGTSASTNDSRYNMCARVRTPATRSTRRKRASVNYVEQGAHDSGRDSDYEAKPQTNRASKQTMMPNTVALPAATEPVQGPVQAYKQTTDNSVLPEATNYIGDLSIPDKTDGNNSDLPDKTITQPKNVLPDTTNPQSPDAIKDSPAEPKQSVEESAS